MCPPGYHHNGFMATHALGHMMYGCAMDHLWPLTYIHISCTEEATETAAKYLQKTKCVLN